MNSTLELLPGTAVRARGLRWEVVASEALGPQTLYRLRGLEHAVLGRELDLLHPFESIEPIRQDLRPDRAAPLTNWLVYHQAFLLEQALGPHALLAVQPGRLRFEPYQWVPVLRAIRMSRVRLLLADGVGLGKTIQAGLIITELVARRLAHRLLIVSPAGPLLEQWRVELAERFGLRLQVIDRTTLDEIRRRTELGANPFDHLPLGVISIDFLKQERVLEQLERASYDIVVIDEAHHCMEVGAAADREDSQRRRLAQVLARRCDALLLLTATPHDGNDRSFASLCELLDPSLVDGRGALRGERYRAHVVRRLKHHLLDPVTQRPLFKERVVIPIPVIPDPQRQACFLALQRGLLDLIAPELRRAFRNRRYSDVLAYLALLKRSVSTVAACQETLTVVANRFQQFLSDTVDLQELRRQRLRSLRDYERKLERFGALSLEEEQERSRLEAEDLAQQLAALQREIRRGSQQQVKVADVVAHLDELVGLAAEAGTEDPKLAQLVATLGAIRQAEPKTNILIYTEYIDSQRAVVSALTAAGSGTVLTLSGEDDERTRTRTTAQFRNQDGLILVSTDSAAEGLNLHQRCHHLLHLELPFNPNRLEQRNGRIDRYGQPQEPQIRYLFLRGTFEERILLRLIAKYERQRARLTFVPNTLGLTTSTEAAQARLLKGLLEEDARLFQDEPVTFDFRADDAAHGADVATTELLEEIDRSLRGFEKAVQTHAWLADAGLNAEQRLLQEAQEARAAGRQVESVDLARFVCDAVRLDGGEVQGRPEADAFTVRLPPAWWYGLDELPGVDLTQRLVRLTTHLEVTTEAAGQPVGFLGRAHPLVRRALERVRHLAFGGAAKWGQDPRASAVQAAIPAPALLYTYLGRVMSGAGRELERVLAVQVNRQGETMRYTAASEWIPLADPAKAIRTTALWEQQFAPWADTANRLARQAAQQGFQPLAEAFSRDHRAALHRELASQREWLQQRSEEITGKTVAVTAVQPDLFAGHPPEPTATATHWQGLTESAQRLAAFHADRSQPAAARATADGALRLYQQRLLQLHSRLELRPPTLVPLGVLMLVPETADGA